MGKFIRRTCDYTFKNELGETVKCFNYGKHGNENDRWYCEEEHQKIVDEINKHKRLEATKILKENIIQELRNNIYLGKINTCCAREVNVIINKIKNGDYDENVN